MPDRPVTDVEAALADVAARIPVPDPDVDVVALALADIAGGGPERRDRRDRDRRWWTAAAAVVLAIVVATAALPAGREAVADLLGIGGVRVRLTGGVPAGLGTDLDLGNPISLGDDEADGAVAPSGIGDPAAAFAGRPPGGVTLVWAPSDELPEVLDTGLGLLLTTFPGAYDHVLVEKRVFTDSTWEATTVDGAPALFIGGAPHAFLYTDPQGRPRQDTARLAANALVWERDGVTYRLESSLPLAEARRLAESVEPLDR